MLEDARRRGQFHDAVDDTFVMEFPVRASPRRKGDPASAAGHQLGIKPANYFNAVETDEKVVFRLVPSACTVAMMATAMPAAIRPYSMAVAPE